MSCCSRNWAELPELLLLSIAGRLLSLPDFAAFGSVCRRWRSFLRSVPFHLPPLLLLPSPSPILTTVTLPTLLFPFKPPTLPLCLSSSHGRLIFLLSDKQHRFLSLLDPLTASQTRSPPLPDTRSPFYYAALTSHSLLLLFHSPDTFLYCRPQGPRWSAARLDPPVQIARLVTLKNSTHRRILAINDAADRIVEFFPDHQRFQVRAAVFETSGIRSTIFDRTHFGPQLVECGRDLLLLLLAQGEENGAVLRIDAYKLDLDRMAWVEVKSLPDYALFVDCGGKCAAACYAPWRWGGMGGCVYLAGPGCETWIQLPVGGDGDRRILHYPGWPSPVSTKSMAASVWPSPVWIYPSAFF